MIKRGVHNQQTPVSLWQVPFPSDWHEGRVLSAFDENGDSLQWERAWFDDNILFVDFGVDDHIGKLHYEYTIEGESPVVIDDGNGNQVHITINQYGGVATDPVSFP